MALSLKKVSVTFYSFIFKSPPNFYLFIYYYFSKHCFKGDWGLPRKYSDRGIQLFPGESVYLLKFCGGKSPKVVSGDGAKVSRDAPNLNHFQTSLE